MPFSSARSVVDRLPNEMLCAIFLMCGDRSLASHFQRDPVMHDSGLNPNEVKLCNKTAFILGHVCLRWFEAAHGCPALCFMVGVDYPRREATYALERRLKYYAELLFTALKMASIHFHRQAVEEYDEDTKLCRLFFTSPKLRCVKLTRAQYTRLS